MIMMMMMNGSLDSVIYLRTLEESHEQYDIYVIIIINIIINNIINNDNHHSQINTYPKYVANPS